MKLDYSAAWAEVVAMLRGQRDMLIALAGVFLLLPALFLEMSAPFRTGAKTTAELMNHLSAYLTDNWLLLLIVGLVTSFGQVAILKLLLDPKRPTVSEALRSGLAILPFFFLLNIVVSLIWAIGLAALIIPGLYLMGRTVLAGTAMVAEDQRNPLAAIGRGFAITRGNGWAVFFIVALIWVVGWVVSIAAAAIFGILFALVGGAGIAGFGSALVSSLFGAGLALVLLLLYIALYHQLTRSAAAID